MPLHRGDLYYGHESLRRNGVALVVNERVRNAVLKCNLKNDRMISDQIVYFEYIVLVVLLLSWDLLWARTILNTSD